MRMTGAAHRTGGAVAATARLTLFMIIHHAAYDRDNDRRQHSAYYNCNKIITYPCEHNKLLLSSIS